MHPLVEVEAAGGMASRLAGEAAVHQVVQVILSRPVAARIPVQKAQVNWLNRRRGTTKSISEQCATMLVAVPCLQTAWACPVKCILRVFTSASNGTRSQQGNTAQVRQACLPDAREGQVGIGELVRRGAALRQHVAVVRHDVAVAKVGVDEVSSGHVGDRHIAVVLKGPHLRGRGKGPFVTRTAGLTDQNKALRGGVVL